MATVKRKDRPPAEPRPGADTGPLAAYGPSPFGPHEPDEIDGARVGGLLIRQAPDGSLVAIQQPPKEPDR